MWRIKTHHPLLCFIFCLSICLVCQVALDQDCSQGHWYDARLIFTWTCNNLWNDIHTEFSFSISLIAHAPKTVKVYVNKLTLGFDETDSVEETQTILLSEKDYEGNGLIPLRFVKFQNVNSVILFIEDNLGEEETTQIKQLIFVGSPLDSTDMSALKKVEHEH